jgi:hypothetical protein
MKQKPHKNYRQGEVLVYGLAKTNKKATDYGFKPKADNVIIEGEISGHKHEILNGKLYEKGDKIILEADKGCILKHPEHGSLNIPQGKYEIEIQVEYDEEEHKSKVKD